jgi:hypothetical protein
MNAMKIKAESFHPWRGHVETGNIVVFRDGSEFTITPFKTTQWMLVRKSTTIGPFDGAFDLTAKIWEIEGGKT